MYKRVKIEELIKKALKINKRNEQKSKIEQTNGRTKKKKE